MIPLMRVILLSFIVILAACAPKNPEFDHISVFGSASMEPLERSIEVCDLKARMAAHKGDSYDPVDPDAFNVQTYKDCMFKKGWKAKYKRD